jgi:hypothetical protein
MPDPWGTVLEQPDKKALLRDALALDVFINKRLSTRSLMTLCLMGIHSWTSLEHLTALAGLDEAAVSSALASRGKAKKLVSSAFYHELFTATPGC